MGTFSWPVQIQSLGGGPTLQIEAMVDTGASYTVLPSDVLRELGITATRQGVFELADNRMVEMSMADVWATVNGKAQQLSRFSETKALPPAGSIHTGRLASGCGPG